MRDMWCGNFHLMHVSMCPCDTWPMNSKRKRSMAHLRTCVMWGEKSKCERNMKVRGSFFFLDQTKKQFGGGEKERKRKERKGKERENEKKKRNEERKERREKQKRREKNQFVGKEGKRERKEKGESRSCTL